MARCGSGVVAGAALVLLAHAAAAQDSAEPLAVAQLAAGFYHTAARLNNGDVKCWGRAGDDGRLGSRPDYLGTDCGTDAYRIHVGNYEADSIDQCYAAVHANAECSNTFFYAPAKGWCKCQSTEGECTRSTSASYNEYQLIDSGGTANIGDGTANIGDGPGEMGEALQAVDLGSGRTAVEVVAGEAHTCARLGNGDVKCWGNGGSGQLGSGGTAHIGDGPGEMGGAL
jgi:hypothetical protein